MYAPTHWRKGYFLKYGIDYSQYLPFFYPAFLVVGLMIYFFLRGIVMVFVNLLTKPSEAEPAKKGSSFLAAFLKRKKSTKPPSKNIESDDDSGPASGEEPRPLLTEEKKQIYLMARALFQQKKIVEAAQMLETIDLGEKAVKVLIKHGKIDEAAATLLRLNAADRAAVLLEDSQKFVQAADLYRQMENWAKAAHCYEQLAKQDFQYYHTVSECYLKAEMVDEALTARSKLGLVDDVFQLCVTHKSWAFLGSYLEFPTYSYRVLPLFDAALLGEFLMALELVPHNALLLAQWINYRSDDAMVLSILQKLGGSPTLATVFWQHLDPYGFETMFQRSMALRHQLPSNQIKIHAEALLAIGRAESAHDILSSGQKPPLPITAVVMKI